MYTLRQFGSMINDRVRMDAFADAIKATVRPGDVVLDVGTGTGIFAFLACQQGAAHVYAVDTNPLVSEGPAAAARNGMSDRITFVHGDVLQVDLPSRVDVVLGDIRGRLPGFSMATDLYRDVSARHLAPGGRVIPQRDTVHVAPVSAAQVYEDEVERPWRRNHYGLDLSDGRPSVANSTIPYSLPRATPILPSQEWALLDYVQGATTTQEVLRFASADDRTVHFLALWFDTVLWDGIGYTNAPYADLRPEVYNHLLLPMLEPVQLLAEDVLEVRLRADPAAGDFLFTYDVRVVRPGQDRPVLQRRQSTFDSLPLQYLQRRTRDYRPAMDRSAQLLARAFALFDGSRPVGDVADALAVDFPDLLVTPARALEYAADVSQRYSS